MCRVLGGQSPILMSFSGPFNLASGGFLAAPPLICNLPFGTQGRSWRLESCLQEMEDKNSSILGNPIGPCSVSFISHQIDNINKEKDIKIQMEILKLKSVRIEKKSPIDGLSSRLELAEERIGKL